MDRERTLGRLRETNRVGDWVIVVQASRVDSEGWECHHGLPSFQIGACTKGDAWARAKRILAAWDDAGWTLHMDIASI